MEEKKKATEAANNEDGAKIRISRETRCKSMNLLSGSTTIVCAMLNVPAVPKKPKKAPYRKPDAVKQLESMADAEQQRKHPNTPAKYLAPCKYRDDTANGLTKCIVDYIRLNGGQAERINTIGIPQDTRKQVTDVLGRTRTIGSVTWRPSGSTIGSSDISATIQGRSVKIEIKIGKDRQSQAQRQYQAAIEAAGGLYYIAKNFTEFLSWYQLTFGKGGAR